MATKWTVVENNKILIAKKKPPSMLQATIKIHHAFYPNSINLLSMVLPDDKILPNIFTNLFTVSQGCGNAGGPWVIVETYYLLTTYLSSWTRGAGVPGGNSSCTLLPSRWPRLSWMRGHSCLQESEGDDVTLTQIRVIYSSCLTNILLDCEEDPTCFSANTLPNIFTHL